MCREHRLKETGLYSLIRGDHHLICMIQWHFTGLTNASGDDFFQKKHPEDGNMMVWSDFSSARVTKLCFIEVRLAVQRYWKVLKKYLFTLVVANHSTERNESFFMQERATAHDIDSSWHWLDSKGAELVNLSDCFPDFIPKTLLELPNQQSSLILSTAFQWKHRKQLYLTGVKFNFHNKAGGVKSINAHVMRKSSNIWWKYSEILIRIIYPISLSASNSTRFPLFFSSKIRRVQDIFRAWCL